uniref:Integrator complex subunit 4 n=1 Tax=Ovis aries TaxID=9940 RepID=A0AC11E166_SHEEP
MAAHLKKRVYEEFTKVVQQQQDEVATKKLRMTKPSKSAALHIDLCKATSPADALQYLLQFARKPVEAESVEGVVRILLEHYYKENDASVRLKIASLLGLLSKTAGFSPDCIMDDAINILQNETRLQQYMNRGLPDVQAGFRKGRGTRDQIANIRWITEKAREFQKTSISAFLPVPKPLTVWITINCGKFFKRWEYQTT